jgi:hypothetical protein
VHDFHGCSLLRVVRAHTETPCSHT